MKFYKVVIFLFLLVIITETYSLKALHAMGERVNKNKNTFYILYMEKEFIPIERDPSKPAIKGTVNIKYSNNSYFLGKLSFDKNMHISYEFFVFKEEKINKHVNWIKETIKKYNERDSFNHYGKLIKKSARPDRYVKSVLSWFDLSYFKDNKLGEKYFKKKQKIIPMKEIDGKWAPARIYQ